MRTLILIVLTALAIFGLLGFMYMQNNSIALKKGNVAPSFRLQDDSGNWHTLEDYRGKKIALYFYPKDDTPGCTKQACSFRDGYSALKEGNITVLGVSYDSPESHRAFKEKFHLPFPLLSDTTKEVAKAYGAYQSILNYAAPRRITILIDENGNVVDVMENVSVSSQAQDVIAAFGK